jgi:tetratricopeptide (TPR) repeat protein
VSSTTDDPRKASSVTGDPATPGGAARSGRRQLDPDTLAALVDQRDFLLRSLDDLEREHDAGDVDDTDYETLKDDYTARAARTIRAIESHQAQVAASHRPRSWRRTLVTTAAVVAFAVLAGVLVAQASGRRGAGDMLTGDIRQSSRMQLAEALDVAAEGDYDGAIEIYDDVLDAQPDNVEALTYKGWIQYRSGDPAGAVGSLTSALSADAEYPDTHAFLAIILNDAGQTELALQELERLDALDPPPDMLQLVAGLRAELEGEG